MRLGLKGLEQGKKKKDLKNELGTRVEKEIPAINHHSLTRTCTKCIIKTSHMVSKYVFKNITENNEKINNDSFLSLIVNIKITLFSMLQIK